MTKEQSLSEKKVKAIRIGGDILKNRRLDCYPEEDIKQSIKRLKELGEIRLENKQDYDLFCDDLLKIFGDKLVESERE